MVHIFDWGKIDKKIYKWVHEEPNNIMKINRRALIVAVSSLVIGGLISLIIVVIMKIGG